VPTGNPGGRVDADEPRRIAEAAAELRLRYVALTSVDRDDLADGGSELFARAVEELKRRNPRIAVEVLIPDFSGNPRALDRIVRSGADVLGHNVETVRSLSPKMRDRRAGYEQSLAVLSSLRAGATDPARRVKSGLMLGLGELRSEVSETLEDLRRAGVDTVTVGQYLRPTAAATPVTRFVSPAEFEEVAAEARAFGFRSVISGPLVRSSYHARDAFEAA